MEPSLTWPSRPGSSMPLWETTSSLGRNLMKKGKECLVSVMLSSWPCETQGSPRQQALPQPCPWLWVFLCPSDTTLCWTAAAWGLTWPSFPTVTWQRYRPSAPGGPGCLAERILVFGGAELYQNCLLGMQLKLWEKNFHRSFAFIGTLC